MAPTMGVFCVWGAGISGLLAVGGIIREDMGRIAGWCVAGMVCPSSNTPYVAGMAPCGGVNP